ncbi:YibE/F family protein, partial [Candidatus Dojkabacteria bacterium]|nr:YibE/F family protein [Candidatus Dojkabacteria bacterium]
MKKTLGKIHSLLRSCVLIFLTLIIVFCSFLSLFSRPILAVEQSDPVTTNETATPEYIRGRVLEVLEEKEIDNSGQKGTFQRLKVEATSGSKEGSTVEIENNADGVSNLAEYKKGDRVLISYSKSLDGKDVYYIYDYDRSLSLLVLLVIFASVAIAVVGKKAVYSFLGLVASFAIIIFFVLPLIQDGKDPILISILGSLVIIPATFYLSHGFNKKTSISVAGTIVALVITGILSIVFVNWTHLTGSSSEEAIFLQLNNGVAYDLRGILLAGIIIGTLGVLDDVTISQA